MTIEIVSFPIKNGDFPWQNVSLPEGNDWIMGYHETTKMGTLPPLCHHCREISEIAMAVVGKSSEGS